MKEHDGITTTLYAKELECMLLWLNELYDKLQIILKKKTTHLTNILNSVHENINKTVTKIQ